MRENINHPMGSGIFSISTHRNPGFRRWIEANRPGVQFVSAYAWNVSVSSTPHVLVPGDLRRGQCRTQATGLGGEHIDHLVYVVVGDGLAIELSVANCCTRVPLIPVPTARSRSGPCGEFAEATFGLDQNSHELGGGSEFL